MARSVAEVWLWGRRVGSVALEEPAGAAAFQYEPAFLRSGLALAPLMMPLAERLYRFPSLPRDAFHGLPGMLADSLPDRFGQALIDVWLARQARRSDSFTAIERLCFIGSRGMGALEYRPAVGPAVKLSERLDLPRLVQVASAVLTAPGPQAVVESLAGQWLQDGLEQMLRVGTCAGGARAKAVIAWNPKTNEVLCGQVEAPDGFEYWLLKLDGVRGNRDRELEDPSGFGVVEAAYSRMAVRAGLTLSECRLLEEGGRRHFMTRRFDRTAQGGRVHMQSLAALLHRDYNAPGACGYEQAFELIRQLGLPMSAVEQQFRRMLFNVAARNHDDHVKNIAFLMDQSGVWQLAPAFDVTFAFNPHGLWTSRHQMSINGRREGFSHADFHACGRIAGLPPARADQLLEEVCSAVADWPQLAAEAGVTDAWREHIQASLQLQFPRT